MALTGDRGPRCRPRAVDGAFLRKRFENVRLFTLKSGTKTRIRHDLVSLRVGSHTEVKSRRGNRTDCNVVEKLDKPLHLSRPLRRRRQAISDHVEGSHSSTYGRNRRRADNLASRKFTRKPQLGLPLLLVAGLDLHFYALLHSGYTEEARHWKDWVLRAVAGSPSQLNIMYGVRGERRLTELNSHG